MIGIDGGHPCWIVANKSDRTLYIDKGNSFSYKNNTPTCLFSNASYTSGKEKNSGVGINLGSVANAVGIGGIAGTLMNGMNVGGGRTTQNSTTIQEQRVLALAPKAVYKLCDWTIDASDFAQIGFRPRKIGRTWHFENTNTPYSVRGVLRYSQTEDFAETQDITVSNYVNDIVLDKRQSLRKFKKARVVDNPIYANNAKEYTITNDNYGNYFDNETGDALEDAPFNNGDILKIANVSDKYFVINKNLTILPAGDNTTFKNVGFNFVSGSEGSVVDGITIENNAQKWVNNNQIHLIPILIQYSKNVTVVNSYIHSSANHAFALANSSYCNIKNNTLSTITSVSGGWGGKTTFLISLSRYNNITDNKMYSTSANVIQFLFGFAGVKVGNGISEFNLIKNNYLNGTTGMNSAMCYGIKIMGNNAAGKPTGQNTFAGNVISNAFIGIQAQGDVKEVIAINNTFINVKTGIDVYSNVADGGIVVKGNSINASNIGILLKKGYAIIENNTINADSYGIQFTSADSKNSIVDNNVIISGKDYAISVAGTNTSITNNYIISKDYYGNGAVTSKNNDTLIENNTPAGASIDADIFAIINKNATIKIDVLPFDANGNVTIKFNGKSETINFNASQTIVYDLGVLGVGDYEVTVIYNGNAKYNATNITKTFSIGKISDYNVTLNTTDVVAGENSTLVIVLPGDATGVVNVTVGKDSYKANVTGGVASVKINSLIAGDYKVNVTYSGDKTYEVSNNVFNLAHFFRKCKVYLLFLFPVFTSAEPAISAATPPAAGKKCLFCGFPG